jgi:hypothetical protein
MTKKQKYILLSIVSVACFIFVFIQYRSQKNEHERLLKHGRWAPVVVKEYTSWGVDYVSYFFVTSNGQQIRGSRKCGKDCSKYEGAFAVYNPTNPTEYQLSLDFAKYYPTWRIIFFFFMYLPVMTFVCFGIISSLLSLFLVKRIE